jgi:peptide subunit release factor 1 (eRF1)
VQVGAARELLVTRGMGGKLRQCLKCRWTDRSADRQCSTCGGERREVALRAALPELARKYGVPVEVVAGEAGKKLRAAGGLAAWLR